MRPADMSILPPHIIICGGRIDISAGRTIIAQCYQTKKIQKSPSE